MGKELEIVKIKAVSIPDAWFQCVEKAFDLGSKFTVEQGSFVGETRLQFDFIVIEITKPYAVTDTGSYDAMLPEIPPHLNIPNPVASGYIEQYMPYLMTAVIGDEEQYTYGSRMLAAKEPIIGYDEKEQIGYDFKGRRLFAPIIDYFHHDQVEHWIKVLKETPNTNQAVLQVAEGLDVMLSDPPCLRQIGMVVKEERLIFFVDFRSWDLWGGFPANLAGLAVMQKDIADRIGIEAGEMIATSKGLHIYGYVEELAKLRANKI